MIMEFSLLGLPFYFSYSSLIYDYFYIILTNKTKKLSRKLIKYIPAVLSLVYISWKIIKNDNYLELIITKNKKYILIIIIALIYSCFYKIASLKLIIKMV